MFSVDFGQNHCLPDKQVRVVLSHPLTSTRGGSEIMRASDSDCLRIRQVTEMVLGNGGGGDHNEEGK